MKTLASTMIGRRGGKRDSILDSRRTSQALDRCSVYLTTDEGQKGRRQILRVRCLHRCTSAREFSSSPKKSYGPGCFSERTLAPHVFGKSADRAGILCEKGIEDLVRLPIGSLTTSFTVMFTVYFILSQRGAGGTGWAAPTPPGPPFARGGSARVSLAWCGGDGAG